MTSKNWQDDIQLHYVETVAEAEAFLSWLGERRPILSIDTETTGLEYWTRHFTRLIQFGDGLQGWTLSIDRWKGLADLVLSGLREAHSPVVFHNAPFDMHAIDRTPGLTLLRWSQVHDTLVMDHLVCPNRAHGLKPLARREWGNWTTVGQDMLKQHFHDAKVDWATVSLDEPLYTTYAGLDTVLTARLAELRGKELAQRGMLSAYNREMEARHIVWRSEQRGLPVDTEYATTLRDQWAEEMIQLRLQLDAYGVQNPNAKRDVVNALKRKENWDPEEFTETGEPKLDKKIMKNLTSDIAPLVIRYKRLVKWTSAYLDKFADAADGLVYPSTNTLGAVTGRQSIRNPALATLPKSDATIRNCILPYDGHHLWAIDYKAMELREIANVSQDPGLLQMFADGLNPHAQTAALVYGHDYDDVLAGKHPVDYGTAKNTVFSYGYGGGLATIAATAGRPEKAVQAFIRSYDVKFPGMSRLMKQLEYEGRAQILQGEEPHVTTPYGRSINCDPQKLYRLMNYKIQGTCADVLKDKMVLLDKMGYGDNIMLPVHDELILSFPVGDTESPEHCRILMEEHDRTVPLLCDMAGPVERWGALYG